MTRTGADRKYRKQAQKRRRMLVAGVLPLGYRNIGWPVSIEHPEYLWEYWNTKASAWNRKAV